jgi:hypothetical protein
MRICYACGVDVPGSEKIGRQEICSHCGADLHCCLNCSLHDDYAENKCRESSAEWVSDRGKSNFCDFFDFRDSRTFNNAQQRQKEAREKLDALFKKK